ncbi:hypothetical protein HK104_003980, partial [Borealophlyctis nickersoniae]
MARPRVKSHSLFSTLVPLLLLLLLTLSPTLAQLPPLFDFSTTTVQTSRGTEVIVIGGLSAGSTTGSSAVYSLLLNNSPKWATLVEPSSSGALSVTGHAAVPVRDGKILVLFGVTTYDPLVYNTNSSVTIFDPATLAFTLLPVAGAADGPAPRYGHAAAYDPAKNQVWMWGGVGGRNQTNTFRQLWLLDLSATPAQWSRMPQPPPFHVGSLGAVAVMQRAYLLICFGTEDAEAEPRSGCLFFDTNERQWLNASTPDGAGPDGRSAGRAVALTDSRVYISGGGNYATSATIGDAWILNVSPPNIAPVIQSDAGGPVPSARLGHGLAAYADKVIVFGGHPRPVSDPSDEDWYVYNSGGQRWINPDTWDPTQENYVPPGVVPGSSTAGGNSYRPGAWSLASGIIVFSALVVIAAVMVFRVRRHESPEDPTWRKYWRRSVAFPGGGGGQTSSSDAEANAVAARIGWEGLSLADGHPPRPESSATTISAAETPPRGVFGYGTERSLGLGMSGGGAPSSPRPESMKSLGLGMSAKPAGPPQGNLYPPLSPRSSGSTGILGDSSLQGVDKSGALLRKKSTRSSRVPPPDISTLASSTRAQKSINTIADDETLASRQQGGGSMDDSPFMDGSDTLKARPGRGQDDPFSDGYQTPTSESNPFSTLLARVTAPLQGFRSSGGGGSSLSSPPHSPTKLNDGREVAQSPTAVSKASSAQADVGTVVGSTVSSNVDPVAGTSPKPDTTNSNSNSNSAALKTDISHYNPVPPSLNTTTATSSWADDMIKAITASGDAAAASSSPTTPTSPPRSVVSRSSVVGTPSSRRRKSTRKSNTSRKSQSSSTAGDGDGTVSGTQRSRRSKGSSVASTVLAKMQWVPVAYNRGSGGRVLKVMNQDGDDNDDDDYDDGEVVFVDEEGESDGERD